MEKEIMAEIRSLKSAICKLIGTSDLPAELQFSNDALEKASLEYRKLSIERGLWVSSDHISKHIKGASYGSAQFIIKHFAFINYFKRGNTFYLNKESLIAFDKELKARNINFERYRELLLDQEKFKKSLESLTYNKKGQKNKKDYKIPSGIKNITTSEIAPPSVEMIREDIKRLKKEFFEFKLAEYIDIYNKNYAMLKFMNHFQKYLDPEIRKRSKKWCEGFNYANHALELITKKKEIFVPVKDDEMIEL